ncbi:MAG: HD domain-containing protein, partial [Acetomicrobium sp.]|nr:HD domain-containing protein [Acetomicrobium sp.]
KLTIEEYELVKTHPRVGFEILKSIEFSWPIAEIIYQHHEKLDGSGYPRGLRGSEIHPLTLILTVADVVEAMVSDRPYRKGLPVATALAEIEAFKGMYYDPWVVEACSSLLKNGEFSFKD